MRRTKSAHRGTRHGALEGFFMKIWSCLTKTLDKFSDRSSTSLNNTKEFAENVKGGSSWPKAPGLFVLKWDLNIKS